MHLIGGIIWRRPKDFKAIPIVINNFNRLEYLKQLIASLESRGYHNIHIIDNNSTYPPLLKYYDTECAHEVIRLDKNIGYLAIWETDIYKRFWKGYYVYTDPDVVLDESCPDDFLEHFWKLADKYGKAIKVGFGLRIDDLPDHYIHKQKVIEWESQFWENELEPGVFIANIDTTFALYKPFTFGWGCEWHRKTLRLRTGWPYVARHMPWYVDSKNLNDEEKYYMSQIKTSTHWTSLPDNAEEVRNPDD